MGIPRLASHLSPFATEKTLGCSIANCTKHRASRQCIVVIDGPGLAYHVYHRLLAHQSSTLNALEAQPSYEELGKAAVLYLDELSRHKIEIKKIFFDGFLPPKKRETRISRLQSYLRQLINFNSSYSNGLLSGNGEQDLFVPAASMLFDSSRPIPNGIRGLPASPFLVSAVIDALVISQYADIIEVVPGEADAFCANAARKLGGVVLTSDSDLLLYDLGQQGGVAFFSQLESRCLEKNGCHVFNGFISSPNEIADCLGVDSLIRLAFELQLDHSISLHAAVKLAKVPLKATQTIFEFQNFSAEYLVTSISSEQNPTASLEVTGSQASLTIDPRISELILQCRSPGSQEIYMYLPFLIDDPLRVSAWEASSELRCLAYCLLLKDSQCTRAIREHSRKGFRIMPLIIDIPGPVKSKGYVKHFKDLADAVEMRLPNATRSAFWRTFAMVLVVSWYNITERRLPSYDTVTKVLVWTKLGKTSWEIIQLSAQHQGVIYSMRLIKQILGHLVIRKTATDENVMELLSVVEDLPPLSALLPSNRELQKKSQYNVDTQIAIEVIKELSHWRGSSDEAAKNAEISSSSNGVLLQTEDQGAWAVKESKKSKAWRRKHSESGSTTAKSVEQTNNPYSILA